MILCLPPRPTDHDIKTRPMIALGFGALAAYVPLWTGAAINTGWVFLSALLPWFLLQWTRAHTWLSLFALYAVLSFLWTPDRLSGIESGWHLFVIGCAFLVGTRLKNLRAVAIGALAALLISDVVAGFQFAGLKIVYFYDRPAGLFVNPMIFGWVSAFVALLLWQEKLRWWLPACLPGLWFSQSRGAVIVIGVYVLLQLRPVITQTRARMICVGAGVLMIVALMIVARPATLLNRLDLWSAILPHLTLFGHGIGSSEVLIPSYYNVGGNTARMAHNDALQFVFEYGAGAVLLLAALYHIVRRGTALSLSFAALAFLDHPLHVPATAFLIAIAAGHGLRVRSDNGGTGIYSGQSCDPWMVDGEPHDDRNRRNAVSIQS